MDTKRLRTASLQMRRNRRELRRARGEDANISIFDDDFVPLGNDAAFAGLDVTAEELVLFNEARYERARTKIGLLTKWAAAGLATEMTMHEVNGLLSSLSGQAAYFQKTYPEDNAGKRLGSVITRLSDDFSFLSRFRESSYTQTVGPKKILEAIRHEFSQALGRGDLAIEATDAFLKSSFSGADRALFSVFNNLVRNGYQWASRVGMRPAVVRLDARSIEYMGEDWDEETDTTTAVLRTEDVVVVSDNGPGVNEGLGDSVFDPSVSGRGSAGIGLHLCRAVLESGGSTIVLSEEKSDLGGAMFTVGRFRLLRPDEPAFTMSTRPREAELADALDSMVELVIGGFKAEAADLADVYEQAAGLAMRIRLRGSETSVEERLLEAVDAFDEAVRTARPVISRKAPAPLA
jgi:nitrogen-specific signal transduction histidine kinase